MTLAPRAPRPCATLRDAPRDSRPARPLPPPPSSRSLPAGHGHGTQPWAKFSYSSGSSGVHGTVLGVVDGTSASVYKVDESSGTSNAGFFEAAFGVVVGARRSIRLKPTGDATVAPLVVFVQSCRSDTKSIVSKSALPDCVFTCVSHGAGKDKGEGYKSGSSAAAAAGGAGGAGAT